LAKAIHENRLDSLGLKASTLEKSHLEYSRINLNQTGMDKSQSLMSQSIIDMGDRDHNSKMLAIETSFLKNQLTKSEVDGKMILMGLKTDNWKGKYQKIVILHVCIVSYGVSVLIMQFFK
jgi:hypothetical protein